MTQCARCCCIGAICVTGAPGRPGRPRRQRLADGDSITRGLKGTTASPIDVSSPGPQCTSTLRDVVHKEVHASDDMSALCGAPSIDQSPVTAGDILPLADQLGSPSQIQGLFGADEQLNAMFPMGDDSSTALNFDIDPLLTHWEGVLPPTFLPQGYSAANSLTRFREKIDQRIMGVEAYYSVPSEIMPCCKDQGVGRDDENPVALLLICSRELMDIIRSLSPVPPFHTHTEDALSTEVLLLALSGYLALMRLIDALFHRIYTYLCQVPRKSYASLKVKSVLRIGGVSALQDMPLKAYAAVIVDVIQNQVQIIERSMGIPPEYCLAGEAIGSSSTAAADQRFYSRPDRTRLFCAVMEQDDIKSRRGSMSYVESIRTSIKESMAFLDD